MKKHPEIVHVFGVLYYIELCFYELGCIKKCRYLVMYYIFSPIITFVYIVLP